MEGWVDGRVSPISMGTNRAQKTGSDNGNEVRHTVKHPSNVDASAMNVTGVHI